jgi:hypothetical protein
MTSHRELAEEEAAVWIGLYPEQRKPYEDGIGSYWKVHAPERSEHQVVLRHTVWRAHNEALWEEVAKGMPIGTATRLVAKARSLKLSIEECIEQYKAGNTVAQTADGRVIRKNYASKRPSEPPPPPEPPEFASEWSSLRELIEDLARRALSGEDPAQTEPLIANFIIDMKEGIAYMRRVLQRKGEFTVKRQRVIDSCRFLGLDPPPPGTLANADIFRRNAKQLRRDHHQDKLGSAYDNEYYLNIGRALDYLERYNETLSTGTVRREDVP